MKLAKKMLASVIALAMVAALALTAFAAQSVVSLTATQYEKVGDEITVTVSATGMAGLMSADLEFAYDATALEFLSIKKAADAAYDMGVGDKVADGQVTWSLMFLESATADSGLAVLTFKVLKEGDTTVSVKYNSWDGDGVEMPADATVTVAQKVVVTEKPTEAPTAAPTTEPGSVIEPDKDIIQTGDAGVAAIAGVMAIAAVAFVATRKKDEE